MKNARRGNPGQGMSSGDAWRVLRSEVWGVERDATLRAGAGGEQAQIALLAGAVATLIGAEIARARKERRDNDDGEALDEIARTLSGTEWDADTPSVVARIVRRTGRTIADTESGP